VVGFEPRLLSSGRKIPTVTTKWKLGGPQSRSDRFGRDINHVLCRGSIEIETRFLVHSAFNLDAKPTAPSLQSKCWGMNGVGVRDDEYMA
jgi:hypothetical protein